MERNKKGIINDFEEISSVNSDVLREKLSGLPNDTIVKASIGTSPENAEYLSSALSNIDFAKKRENIGRIRIEEVEAAQQEIIKAINQ